MLTFFPGPANFETARAHCQELGGDLASVHSEAENGAAIAAAAGATIYIGFMLKLDCAPTPPEARYASYRTL